MRDDRLQQIRRGYADDGFLDDEPPDLGPLRALAESAELADAVAGLADAYGRPLPADDPLAPLAREIARALTEAGFTLHPARLVRAHGETGITARLEPATIDGLVYSSCNGPIRGPWWE